MPELAHLQSSTTEFSDAVQETSSGHCEHLETLAMTSSSTSSSYERGEARLRDKANYNKRAGSRSSSLDESSCSSSDAEKTENGNSDHRRKSGKDWPSHREGRRYNSCEKSRKRKRSSGCSTPTRKKLRCSSDSDRLDPRSRSSKRLSNSQCKYSPFHKRYWHRSRCSRNDTCRGVSYHYPERGNRTCYKKNGRRSRSLGEKRSGGKHHQCPSTESSSHGSSCRTLQTSKVRRQTSCNVSSFQDKTYLQTESESLQRDTQSGSSARLRKERLEEESRSYYGSPSRDKGRHCPPLVHKAGTDLKEKLRSSGRSTDELFDRRRDWLGPSIRRKYGEDSDQLIKPGTTGTDAKNSSDWLDLSLKAPAKPTPKIEGISGEDFRLCLDPTLPSTPAFCDAGELRIVVELASGNDDTARGVSSCREGLDASLCSTSYFSVQAGLASCNDSPSGRSSPLEVACTRNRVFQETTSNLKVLTTSPSLHPDRYPGSSGSPLELENKTKEERCVYPPNELIPAGGDKAKMVAVADTDIVDGPLMEVAVSCKGELPSANATTSPARMHVSVSAVKHSNSLSAQENDGVKLVISVDKKKVNSVDGFALLREKTGVSTTRDILASRGVEPSPRPEAPKPRTIMKTGKPLDTSCLVVELSDSTTIEEGDDECAGETQSQPAPAISQLNETTDKRKSHPALDVKDPGCLKDDPTGSTSLAKPSEASLQKTGTCMVQNSSDLDHATDLFIKKVHSLLTHARPHSPKSATRLNRSSKPKETPAEQPKSKDMSTREDPCSSRRVGIEVVDLSAPMRSKVMTKREDTCSSRRAAIDVVDLSAQMGGKAMSKGEDPCRSRRGGIEAVDLSTPKRSKNMNKREDPCSSVLERSAPLRRKGMRKREDPCSSRRGKIEVVELSDSSSEPMSASDESDGDIELDVSTNDCSHVCERQFKPLEPHNEAHESAGLMNDHPTQYLNEDVVCCSNKPPLKRARVNCGEEEQNRVTYVRDRYGNLIQVVDVDDSDAEDDYEELDTMTSDGEKEDEFFSSHPQVQPIIEEIKEMLEGDEDFSLEKSGQADDHSEPSSPPAVTVTPTACGQITSDESSERERTRKVVMEVSNSQERDWEREAINDSKSAVPIVKGKQREKWKRWIMCDLCSLGPSIALGEWYCWCCSRAATSCECPEEKKLRKQLSLGYRKGQKQQKRGKQILRYLWSGKVHKMCALWSSEVYVQQSPKKEPFFAQLETAVKRGNTLVCKHPTCKKTGATLGCRVRSCRRSYHYPCAVTLANQCMLRMWDGVLVPVACQYHRHVEDETERARERLLRSKITDPVRDGKTVVPAERPYIGKKLLCPDIAEGQEQVQIPCTNDVDDEPVPKIQYITKCWFKGTPVDHLHPFGTKLATGCQGCAGSSFDNPHSFMPLHVIGTDRCRESDYRFDWQGELMYGRLPYNTAGLLQLGPDSKDIIECNSRCKCGPKCKNRELQKGLRCHLELFKTKDRGWGVRALEQIPRGKFVVEYVGDVLTQAEADVRGEKYDQNQLSYLFNLDHPEVPHHEAIVLDGISMSNIARFINHSCEGNLMIFRVFSETTDLRYFRIGMFAIQDIEVGDELSYDYNYALSKDSSEAVDDPTAIRCFCGAPSCRKWLWRGGDSGLKH
ncbi:hypothetical protein R1flu_014587 [Riccia fluitans]|uniref:Histone-lysine N-methyltransferase n=1 Tax=Riccia fluitans TaxID=41844 RepID=A0ABD1YGX6_9MARC